MRLRLVWFGKAAPRALDPALDEYAKRLSHFTRLETVEFPEARGPEALAKERDQIFAKLDGFQILSLCVEGETWSTERLAKELEDWRRTDAAVGIVIGSADGLHPDVISRSRWKLSLGRLTLPHSLARVILLEQLYRAHTILQGLPYHRA